MAAPDLLACGTPKHDSCELNPLSRRALLSGRDLFGEPLFSDGVLGVRGHGAAKFAGCCAIAALE
jgi:hypothetical protein